MVCARHFLAVLSLVSLSLGQLLRPAGHAPTHPFGAVNSSPVDRWEDRGELQASPPSRKLLESRDQRRWMPKRTSDQRQRSTAPPQLRPGGVELEVHVRHRSRTGVEKRAMGNGTELDLATSES